MMFIVTIKFNEVSMKIEKGDFVAVELITSESIHEAVVKCFVAAGFYKREDFGDYENSDHWDGLGVQGDNYICWMDDTEQPLTLQQLFTAENGLQWPDWANEIQSSGDCVWFSGVVGRAVSVCLSDYFAKNNSPIKCKEFIAGREDAPIRAVKTLATRQPKEREVKTIKDAVIELDGVFPKPDGNPNSPEKGAYYCGKLDSSGLHLSNGMGKGGESICTREEFESTAKQLGYINGYRWGVEYPTNGKRPDLSSDVWLSVKEANAAEWDHPRQVLFVKWSFIQSFKVTDQRHKPADTSYLNASTQSQSLTHSEERLTHSEWYDYENQKALRLPDVGIECEIKHKNAEPNWACPDFHPAIPVFFGKELVVFCDKNDHETVGSHDDYLFRPLDHATRKAELEKKRVVDAAYQLHYKCADYEDFVDRLYSEGCLRLPEQSK